MKINSVLNGAAMNLRSLKGRLEVQRSATHDPSDKSDIAEWLEDTQNQIAALEAIASAYGPIIQSAIDTGMLGVTHRIAVQVTEPENGTWVNVSTHDFTCEENHV